MKKILLMLLAFCSLAITSQAQTLTTSGFDRSGFYGSVRGGYDILPMYDNNTPYIDYKGGLALGVSAKYYWNWIGIGADFDFIKNKPKSTYPTSNIYTSGGAAITGLYNISQKNALQKNKTLVENLKTDHFQKRKIVIPVQEGLEFVAINTIIRCEGVNGYIKIYLTEGTTILSSNSIGYFNKLLDIDGFYLVHKSHLINLDYVLKYLNEGCLIMENQEHVPVARNKRSEFLQFISNKGKL